MANHAAGTGDSRERISLEAINSTLEDAMARVRRILACCVQQAAGDPD